MYHPICEECFNFIYNSAKHLNYSLQAIVICSCQLFIPNSVVLTSLQLIVITIDFYLEWYVKWWFNKWLLHGSQSDFYYTSFLIIIWIDTNCFFSILYSSYILWICHDLRQLIFLEWKRLTICTIIFLINFIDFDNVHSYFLFEWISRCRI